MRAVLDEQEAPLVTPGAPPGGILGEPEVVDQEERPCAGAAQSREFGRIGSERLRRLVETRHQSSPHQRLDLRAAVEGRGQDLIAPSESGSSNAVPEGVSPLR